MGNRWGPDGPPPEAYSRVTNPERFVPVIAAADALVQRLVATYDVLAEPVQMERTTRAVRLQPTVGAQITIGITSHPAVNFTMGHWCRSCAPRCGCDACDETADEAIEEFLTTVEDVVAGRFVERLTRRPRRLWTESSTGSGWSHLESDQFRRLAAMAPPGIHEWPPWPRRQPVLAGLTA